MIGVEIKFDFESMAKSFEAASDALPKIADKTVKEINKRFALAWKEEAKRELSSSLKQYIEGIIEKDEGMMSASVSLIGDLNNKVENGAPPYDMKEDLLSGDNARYSYESGRYNTVKFKHGVPGTLKENSSNIMTKEVYKQAKQLKEGKRLQSSKQPITKIIKEPGTGRLITYMHKYPIEHNMQKEKDHVTAQNTYSTYRRVSDSSDPASWIHPGFQARNLADKALSKFNIERELPDIFNYLFDTL